MPSLLSPPTDAPRTAAPRPFEPRMLIGGVVGDKVQDELEVALVGLVEQGVQILKGSEERMDIGVIGNVIAKIGHRRRIDGREPESVNTEPAQIIQFVGDSGEIPYPIAIAIEKTPRVDLINHPRLPPLMCLRHTSLSLMCAARR